MHLWTSRDPRLSNWNFGDIQGISYIKMAPDKQDFLVEWRIEFCTNKTSGRTFVLEFTGVPLSQCRRIGERKRFSKGEKLTVAALLSRIKELTKHDNHDSHKSHNRCEKSDGRTGWTKRGEKASRRIEISTELNKYYFDNRQAKRARLSVIRPRGCRLLRNYKGIMRPGILRARCNRPRITGRRNNREHSCNLSTSIETRTRARYNYESFAPLAMLGGRMESNEGARWLKGFFLRGRNEDHAFTLQAFRDVAIINRIMLPREIAERATLPQSFTSRPHFAIVT